MREDKPEIYYYYIDLMGEHGMKPADVSRASGVPPSSLSRYMNGGDMPASTAKSIADAIGVTVDELLGIKNDMPKDEQELLDYYRSASVRGKANILEYAEDAARRHPKNTDDSAGVQTA